MNFNVLFTILALLASTGSQLEISGDFLGAGRAYNQDGDAAGQVRVICRYLEESLYSGNSIHALELMMRLEQVQLSNGCMDFWYGRLAWSCGLPEYSIELLDSLDAGPWLKMRARGLAQQYRGDPDGAVEDFRASLQLAETAREKFYSALDLSFALIQLGDFQTAGSIASWLSGKFPGEGMPLISLALSLQGQGRFGEAMSVLQNVYASSAYSYISRDMARSLMNDLE
jgi:hypothetical protein